MSVITRKCSALFMTAVLAVVGALLVSGCGGDNGAGSSGGGSYVRNTCTSAETCKSKEMPDGKTWMTENLNIETADSWCHRNSADSCKKYGRLYTWAAAKTACPTGWHLPTRDEWDKLAESVGGTKSSDYGKYHDWNDAGKALKSTSGWNDHNGTNGNGTDTYGFKALPGGRNYNKDDSYGGGDCGGACGGAGGFWWTATEYSKGNACTRIMYSYSDGVDENYGGGNYGVSVRCVAD